jgi:D-alanyl-D-alanine carboxypeptidase
MIGEMIRTHRILVVIMMCAAAVVGIAAGVKLEENRQARENSLENFAGRVIEDASRTIPQIEPSFKSGEVVFTKKPPAKPVPVATPLPNDGITAEAYLVGDVLSGKVYASKNPDKVLQFASMSKLVTAIVSTRIYTPTTTTAITEEHLKVSPDSSNLKAGEVFTVKELLYPLLITSSNVAGEALASIEDREEFLELMSEYVWELGMPQASLSDPTGLSESNSGTASAFFGLAQYLYRERKDLLAITRLARYTIATSTATSTPHGSHTLKNTHPFSDDPRYLGGKTGYTPTALDTMLTVLNIKDRPVAFVVLRSRDRAKDTTVLINRFTQTSSL